MDYIQTDVLTTKELKDICKKLKEIPKVMEGGTEAFERIYKWIKAGETNV